MHGMNNIKFNKFIMRKTSFYIFLLFFVFLSMSINWNNIQNIHSFSILSDERSKASSKTIPPHSAI